MDAAKAEQIADTIIELYRNYGHEAYAGEQVSQLQHMYQAALLAQQQGYDEEVVLAAFLHDIGHICIPVDGNNEMGGYGIRDHEEAGSIYLEERGFSQRLRLLVQSHVEAKRYLTFRYPEYYDALSEASKKTLQYQGGRMNQQEANDFESQPLFDLIIQLRRWDDEAKDVSIPAGSLQQFHSLIMNYLQKQ